ncbi:MAG: hypothetical protein HOG28_03095, partial [Actinobacteria bacterium]|nr:hypothetical protein [Actinomycetota bacterium]
MSKGDHGGRGLTARRNHIKQRPNYRQWVLYVALFSPATGSYPVTVLSASLPRIATQIGTTDDT